MKVRLIEMPYAMGFHASGMGAGPRRFLEGGADGCLRCLGAVVRVERIETGRSLEADPRGPAPQGRRDGNMPGAGTPASALALDAMLAGRVREAGVNGEFPLVLAGDCNSALGTLAGLQAQGHRVGIVWFDAHGDFNTPETSPSGWFDGMALAAATGRCWREETRTGLGLEAIDERDVVLAGARALDPLERTSLEDSGVTRVTALEPGGIRPGGALEAALAALAGRVDGVYLHVDLDALDAGEAVVNRYSAPGGFTLQELESAIAVTGGSIRILSAALTAYDPSVDIGGRGLAAGLRVLQAITRAAGARDRRPW
ncbi:MAG: arginase family protein [Gemmatimonadetes bacterium]|nr:arginase family protein [Gemmatimonadota bacterium]